MSTLSITVVFDDGKLVPVAFDGDDFAAAVRKSLQTSQELAVKGFFVGKAMPRCVELRDEGGALLFSITVHPGKTE